MTSLEDLVIEKLRERNWRVGTAESLTAGCLAKRLADCRGAGEVFAGGVVSYQKAFKAAVLAVDTDLLGGPSGAVSQAVAEQMATGVTRLAGVDVGIATTGVAGPDEDEDGNPVGRVFVATVAPGGIVAARALDLSGLPQQAVCDRTIEAALALTAEILSR